MNKNAGMLKVYAIGAMVILALLLGLMLVNSGRQIIALVDPQVRQSIASAEIARLEAKTSWAAVSVHLSNVLNWSLVFAVVTFGAVFVYKLGGIAIHALDLRSSIVRPRGGMNPLFVGRDGRIIYPDREIVGDREITQQFLKVQSNAAWAADKLTLNVNTGRGEIPALAMESEEQQDNLPTLVRARDVIRNPSLESLTIGVSESGLVQASLYDLMHVLAVGSSGFGKSAFLRALIWQLAQVRQPVDIVAIDVNGSEFNTIMQWDKLLYPVARETNEAIATLQAVKAEIDKRKGLYEAIPQAYDLPSYNRLSGESLNPIVVFTDEGTNLLNQDGIGDPLRMVTQTARQYGVFLVLAGQSAKHSVIDTQTRDNFSSRLCFHTSPSSFRVVLGQSVDGIKHKGRAWAQLAGRELQQIQVPFISRDQVAQIIETGRTTLQFPDLDTSVTQSDTAQRIKALHNDGLSMNQIQMEVFGYTGGRAYSQVKDVLG